MPELIAIAAATFASEDLACIAAGILVAQGRVSFLMAVIFCAAGIYAGDLALFWAGRFLGRTGRQSVWLNRYLPAGALAEGRRWIERRGLWVVLVSRFTPGLRLPVFAAAGALGIPAGAFSLYLLAATLSWTPLLVGSAAVAGPGKGWKILLFAAIALVSLRTLRSLLSWKMRRRILGMFRRWSKWEFWPCWLAYIPIVVYIAGLAIRRRTLTAFLHTNPGIENSGFAGESKAAILRSLPWVPAWRKVAGLGEAQAFVQSYPVVAKPDVGERGRGVAILRNAQELDQYFLGQKRPVILQEYVNGPEYGVYYCRLPGQTQGRILSITSKMFPSIIGDGSSTLEELVLRDPRAVCLHGTYRKMCRRDFWSVPAAGETIPLTEIGSHCRGTVFLDGRELITPELENAAHFAASKIPGFYLGRFDVRSASPEDFQAGRFRILELNGVSAEPGHVYDPAVGIWEAYRTLFAHWRHAFEIGTFHKNMFGISARIPPNRCENGVQCPPIV